jgi:hypothetical protein
MAEQAQFRPAARNDGFGNVFLTAEELADPEILEQEADRYARKFTAEEDAAQFFVSVAIPSTRCALVYVIEAARCLCSAQSANREVFSRRLLELAINDLAGRFRKKL